jgi:hypothetical protein
MGSPHDGSVTYHRHFFDCVASLAVPPRGGEPKKVTIKIILNEAKCLS